MPSALSVVRDNECKIIVNEKNAVKFCGSDDRSLAVGNYSCCTDSTYQQYFWYSGDLCETKEWPKSIPNRNIPVFSEYGFRLTELFSAAKPWKKFGQAGLTEFFFRRRRLAEKFFGDGGGLGLHNWRWRRRNTISGVGLPWRRLADAQGGRSRLGPSKSATGGYTE